MSTIIGIALGAAVGAATLFFLLRFIKQVSTGTGFVLYGLLQLALPFASLLIIGLVYTPALLPAGITSAAILTIGSITRVLAEKAKNSNTDAASNSRDED